MSFRGKGAGQPNGELGWTKVASHGVGRLVSILVCGHQDIEQPTGDPGSASGIMFGEAPEGHVRDPWCSLSLAG